MNLRLRRLTVCAALLGFMSGGCGPISPLPTPLDEKDQRMVDGMWNNMLTPVNRLDHQTLIDAILVNWLSQLGVDRMRLVSEKDIYKGKVVMEVNGDRANPASDQFIVTVLNEHRRTVRRERYSRSELDKSVEALTRSTIQPTARPAATQSDGPPETPEERQHRIEYERRLDAVRAATQPATPRS